eukprot:jgi/Mesen1/4542/ME000232S03801
MPGKKLLTSTEQCLHTFCENHHLWKRSLNSELQQQRVPDSERPRSKARARAKKLPSGAPPQELQEALRRLWQKRDEKDAEGRANAGAIFIAKVSEQVVVEEIVPPVPHCLSNKVARSAVEALGSSTAGDEPCDEKDRNSRAQAHAGASTSGSSENSSSRATSVSRPGGDVEVPVVRVTAAGMSCLSLTTGDLVCVRAVATGRVRLARAALRPALPDEGDRSAGQISPCCGPGGGASSACPRAAAPSSLETALLPEMLAFNLGLRLHLIPLLKGRASPDSQADQEGAEPESPQPDYRGGESDEEGSGNEGGQRGGSKQEQGQGQERDERLLLLEHNSSLVEIWRHSAEFTALVTTLHALLQLLSLLTMCGFRPPLASLFTHPRNKHALGAPPSEYARHVRVGLVCEPAEAFDADGGQPLREQPASLPGGPPPGSAANAGVDAPHPGHAYAPAPSSSGSSAGAGAGAGRAAMEKRQRAQDEALRDFFSRPRVLSEGDVFAVRPRSWCIDATPGGLMRALGKGETPGPLFYKVESIEPRSSFLRIHMHHTALVLTGSLTSALPPSAFSAPPLGPQLAPAPEASQLASLLAPCLLVGAQKLKLQTAVLLSGPAGVGKRSAARLAARSLGICCIEYNCHELIGSSEKATAAALKQAFETAGRYAPSMLLIRRFQALASVSSGGAAGGGGASASNGASGRPSAVAAELQRSILAHSMATSPSNSSSGVNPDHVGDDIDEEVEVEEEEEGEDVLRRGGGGEVVGEFGESEEEEEEEEEDHESFLDKEGAQEEEAKETEQEEEEVAGGLPRPTVAGDGFSEDSTGRKGGGGCKGGGRGGPGEHSEEEEEQEKQEKVGGRGSQQDGVRRGARGRGRRAPLIGAPPHGVVLLVAAVEDAEELPTSLRRCFTHEIDVQMPDGERRRSLLRAYLGLQTEVRSRIPPSPPSPPFLPPTLPSSTALSSALYDRLPFGQL